MYSDADLESAVNAGAISVDAAAALRAHVAGLRPAPEADQENIRLVTSFNDIFVGIACLLVIFSGLYVGGDSNRFWLGGMLVAVASWLMAEVFTRRRRMALPSIILLIAFVAGLGCFAGDAAASAMPLHAEQRMWEWQGKKEYWTDHVRYPWQDALILLSASVAAAIGAVAHWLRFRVAITVAAGTAALVFILLSGLAAAMGLELKTNPVLAPVAFLCGLGVFALAMRWDTLDRQRLTQRADIAFWLHLLAAPLLAHPLFYWIGVLANGRFDPGQGIAVLAIYALFAIVALVVDRRALLVSALLYVLVALNGLLDRFGSIEANLAISTLLIGCALLALSVFWTPLRRALVRLLPTGWQDKLPATA